MAFRYPIVSLHGLIGRHQGLAWFSPQFITCCGQSRSVLIYARTSNFQSARVLWQAPDGGAYDAQSRSRPQAQGRSCQMCLWRTRSNHRAYKLEMPPLRDAKSASATEASAPTSVAYLLSDVYFRSEVHEHQQGGLGGGSEFLGASLASSHRAVGRVKLGAGCRDTSEAACYGRAIWPTMEEVVERPAEKRGHVLKLMDGGGLFCAKCGKSTKLMKHQSLKILKNPCRC